MHKRLNWTCCRRGNTEAVARVLQCRTLLDGLTPPYMAIHDNGRFHGWDTALEQRAALMDALEKRG